MSNFFRDNNVIVEMNFLIFKLKLFYLFVTCIILGKPFIAAYVYSTFRNAVCSPNSHV